ncbi:MAG: alpha-hydroxy-acid oxidizing protein [Treponema sp.]|nr:alpha-hydroxy-acid oxidizing protein [Treponema sp.]
MNELPGMGGVNDNRNFRLNCTGWHELYTGADAYTQAAINDVPVAPQHLCIAPVTGAVQNIGYAAESDFYMPYFSAAVGAGVALCAGDGYPDEKLQLGIAAVQALRLKGTAIHTTFFIKPYPVHQMIERARWTHTTADCIGTDIDAYAIRTMRDLVHLAMPTAHTLQLFRDSCSVPFAIKGVFTAASVALVKAVRPDIVYISNHGGRVDTREGSTAAFLFAHGNELKKYCREIWVDGGIRTHRDVQTALYYGADRVGLARPLIAALVSGGEGKMQAVLRDLITG